MERGRDPARRKTAATCDCNPGCRLERPGLPGGPVANVIIQAKECRDQVEPHMRTARKLDHLYSAVFEGAKLGASDSVISLFVPAESPTRGP